MLLRVETFADFIRFCRYTENVGRKPPRVSGPQNLQLAFSQIWIPKPPLLEWWKGARENSPIHSWTLHVRAYRIANNFFSIPSYLLNLLHCGNSCFHSFSTCCFVSSQTRTSPSPVTVSSEITSPSNISHPSSYKQLCSVSPSRHGLDWRLSAAKNRSPFCLWILA